MPLVGIRFAFRQRFRVPADVAFRWCVDYDPGDVDLMGEHGRRTVKKLSDETFLLTDRLVNADGRRVRKVKLVRIDPRTRSWTNTHLAGPTRHSQFLYRIVPTGRSSSRLEYVGLQVEPHARRPSSSAIAARSRELRDEDSLAWKKLAKAMEQDAR